jgi:DNA-binding IclR family transcriptional regulator
MLQSPVKRAVLVDLLLHGDNTPANISQNTGKHRSNVNTRLQELESNGYVENKGGGVYALTLEGISAARAIRRLEDQNDNS